MVNQPDKRILRHLPGPFAVPGHIQRKPEYGRIVGPVEHRKRIPIAPAKPFQQFAIGLAAKFLHKWY
jgi:hypothetical protein